MSLLLGLPNEIRELITLNLGYYDLCNLVCINKLLNSLRSNTNFWKNKAIQDCGDNQARVVEIFESKQKVIDPMSCYFHALAYYDKVTNSEKYMLRHLLQFRYIIVAIRQKDPDLVLFFSRGIKLILVLLL